MVSRTAVVAALIAMLACASDPGGFVPATPQRPDLVALAPANFNQSVPELLEPGLAIIGEEIEAHLRRKGCEVDKVAFETIDDVWREAVRELGGLYDGMGKLIDERFDAAAASLVDGLQKRGVDFDALVLPYLTLREGELRGKAVFWDGVRRRIRIDYANNDILYAGFPTGKTEAVSLRVVVFDAAGYKQLDRYGGLELIRYIRIEPTWYYWNTRADLFEAREDLREGVELVFDPYFGG